MNPLPSRPLPRPLVLLADDDEDARSMYSYTLTVMGFDVTIAEGAATIHEHASQIHPDVIVTDIGLGNSDGWALMRHLRRDPRTGDIPVVMMTTDASGTERERATREGCAALCLKSCPPETLAVGVRAVLEQRARASRERPQSV